MKNSHNSKTNVGYCDSPFSRFVLERRAELGLTRSQLAKRMRYTNLNKGCQRIARWERGQTKALCDSSSGLSKSQARIALKELPNNELILRLSKALEVSSAFINDMVQPLVQRIEKAHQLNRKLDAASQHYQSTERELIAQHFGLLKRHSKLIMQTAQFRDIRLESCGILAAYIGGTTYNLNTLLELNEIGSTKTVCDQCSSAYCVLSASGSPLSGVHNLTGFCENVGCLHRQRRLSGGLKFGRFAIRILQHSPVRSSESSDWSLGQLIAYLGKTVPDVRIWTRDFREVARYSNNSKVLSFDHQESALDFGIWFGSSPASAPTISSPKGTYSISEEYGSAKEGGRIVIGATNPLHFGEYRGSTLLIRTSTKGVWTLREGRLSDGLGVVRGFIDAALPPPVLASIIISGALDE